MAQKENLLIFLNFENLCKVNVIFEKGKKLRFVGIKNILTIFENITQRELFIWYHMSISFCLW